MKWNMIYFWLFVILLMCAIFFLSTRFYSGEDGWIRESDGMWVEHGNASYIPKEVREQYDAILCGFVLYSKEKAKNITLNSECLGKCKDYVIDIVNVPRNEDDDKPENQCPDLLSGNVTRFIEIDKEANIIRIKD